MSDVPVEKPDPVKDYEGYKRWRAAQKGAKPAPAAAAPASAVAAEPAGATAPAPSADSAPADGTAKSSASPAAAAAPAAVADANVWPPPDRPNPITHYEDYKAWKARRKAGKGGKAAPAAAAGDGKLRKKQAPHASKYKKKEVDRRSLLFSLGGFMWLLQAGALGTFGALCLRFLFPNVLYEPPKTFKIGPPNKFLPNAVDESFKGPKQIWVVRDDVKIFVLSTVCTHLGCTPNWLTSEDKFKCPCHGSGFRRTGMNFEGPAPRPLERYRVYLADDGQIVVDATKKFLNEAQWADPDASVPA
jgi:cytochrome b6-f complex iron-sulfur subunit